MKYDNTRHMWTKLTILSLLFIAGTVLTPLLAQESCYEQYLREHNMTILTAEDADDSYDELKKTVLAKQMYGDSYLLMVDAVAQRAVITKVDGTYVADVHVALVDSTWYMWLSVDPLADKYPGNTPYMYCNGNPIMLVDPDGREPDEVEAAAMAAYAYGSVSEGELKHQLKDWEPVGQAHKFLGYRAVLFGRKVNGGNEYAYAFAGTDSHSIADIVSDVAQATDLPSQYEIAIACARMMAIKYKGEELTFVGHSLGGGEATAAAMATGKKAITFNPAAVSLSTVARNMLVFPATIENHVVNGDPLTTGQKLVNPLLVGALQRSGLIVLPGKTTVVPQVAGDAHAIDNFLK